MLDGMTNIKASEVLKEIKYYTEDLPPYSPDEVAEALEMAIKALEAQPCEDCISRQKALDCFEQTNTRQGAKYAIETLPSVTPRINLALTSQDCISREEVQDLISRWLSDYLLDETREALETINYKVGDMPSVTPERPKGKWIEVLEHRDEFGSTWHYECSECRGRSYKGFEPLERCCPNCGAEMGGTE